MPETWVHGSAFVPRLYGPEYLLPVLGASGSDFGGAKDDRGARFSLKADRVNEFSAPIPVTGTIHVQRVVVNLVFGPSFQEFAGPLRHPGLERVAATAGLNSQPFFSAVLDSPPTNPGGPLLSNFKTVTLDNINADASRGIVVSLTFSTLTSANFQGAGDVIFYGAGVVFQ